MQPTSTHLPIVQAYWRAEAAGDVSAVLAHFASHARFTAPGFDLSGHDQIRRFYEKIIRAYASMRIDVLRTIEQGDDIVVEFGFHFSRHDGAAGYAEGCNVFTIRNGRFERVRAYFNPADY
jgi:ketosteroid isomerase-like protein